MSHPVDVAADLLVTRTDDIELVTVESLDPDAADGADVLATATNVRAIVGKEVGGEVPAGGGAVGQTKRDFTLIAGDIAFTVKNRDRITRADGTKWGTADVTAGGFGSLWDCRNCTKQR